MTPDVQDYFQKEFLNEKHRQFADIFVPYVIDATSFRNDGYMALAISVPVCLFAAWNLKKAIIRIQNFENSPIYKWLAHYDQQPAMIAEMIEQEMRTNGNASPVRSITLLPSWLLHKTFFGFTVMKVNEIVWMYKKVTRHSVNFIPTGKTYGIVIADMSGRTIEVDAGRGKAQQSVTALMDALQIRLPWITSGYSRELKQLYQKRRRDFTEAVLARRATYQANGSVSGAAG